MSSRPERTRISHFAMLVTTGCAALRRVDHRLYRPTGLGTLPSDQLCLGAPRSHQRTWVNQDGAKPHQSSDNLSPKQNLGAPYLARFWRDVGFHRSIPEHLPHQVCISDPSHKGRRWGTRSLILPDGVFLLRAASSASTAQVQTGNPGQRNGENCGFLFRSSCFFSVSPRN